MDKKNKEKTYTVQEIADMLGVTNVTVWRWINKEKKLKTTLVSKKTGHVIQESDFQSFLSMKPKYQKKIADDLSQLPAWAGVAAIGGIAAFELASNMHRKKTTDVKILASDLKKYMLSEIEELNELISQKEVIIEENKKKIKELEEQIKQYELALSNEELLKETVRVIVKKTEENNE